MKLATIYIEQPRTESERRDGRLVVINDSMGKVALVPQTEYPTLISALEEWKRAEPRLLQIAEELAQEKWSDLRPIKDLRFRSPLPRTYGFLDGSAFLTHTRRVRKSRGAEVPPDLEEVPLMYQGLSDYFIDPEGDIPVIDPAMGVDYEAELAVIVDDVPCGVTAAEAASHIKLTILLNDISLRNLIPAEIARGFGFVQGKPELPACAPYAVTPDELGDSWQDNRAILNVQIKLNGRTVGDLISNEMHFSFAKLIEHAARTRSLAAGTIIGSGTISNSDEKRGVGCLVEKRVIEIIESGKAVTEYLKIGDQLSIEAFKEDKNIYGSIRQKCVKSE